MEKRDARLSLHTATPEPVEDSRIIVALESHRALHHRVHEIVRLVIDSDMTTSELQQSIRHDSQQFGSRFHHQLIRSLYLDDEDERKAVIWLLTLLDDWDMVPQLQHITQQRNVPRAVRLAAALVLAGMGATREVEATPQRVRVYAIG
ncbi:MAG TPA: hypothetical protein VHZ51_03130 [Ktedonobacteraceae bacterium]|nr:hypothetical protein [Ktedonobacteraceae bacterium]